MPPTYQSHILEHLGLVAGMGDARGLAEGIETAIQPDPAMRSVTAGQGVQAMVLNGLGCVTQPRSLGPPCFPHTPPLDSSRLP